MRCGANPDYTLSPWKPMDLLAISVILAAICFQCTWQEVSSWVDRDSWNYLSLRYGVWHKPAPTAMAAIRDGYVRKNNNCKTRTHIGFLYRRHGDTIAMPIYDSNGLIAGIQSSIPGNMWGYNSYNKSIPLPPENLMPPFLPGSRNSRGIPSYTLTAYFKHPRLICNPTDTKARRGRGLFIQMGLSAESEYMEIPLNSKDLGPQWVRGTCMPQMGMHYFLNLSRSMACENLYPVFLMYNTEGKLGAFGWAFQGSPPQRNLPADMGWFKLKPTYYPFLFGSTPLPQCMYNSNFIVSGIQIWLREPNTMLCTAATVSVTKAKTTTVATSRTQATVDIAIENKQPISNADSVFPSLCVITLTLIVLVL